MCSDVSPVDRDENKRENVVALFRFISELNRLKSKAILNIGDYLWHFCLSQLPSDSDNIKVYYRDRTDDDAMLSDNTSDDILLSIHKPEFQRCPAPPTELIEWLVDGWDDYRREVSHKFEAPVTKGGKLILRSKQQEIEQFEQDPDRIAAYENWVRQRNEWADKQRIIEETRTVFADFYRVYFELQRETETEELVVANGMLLDAENPSLKIPVLTRRIQLEYNPDENTIYIREMNNPSELYTTAFQLLPGVHLEVIKELNADLSANDYHPLDRNDTPEFLKALVHQLSSNSLFSSDGVPDDWRQSAQLLLYLEPCYILRNRLDGTLKAIEHIIEKVQEGCEIPAPISEIVCGGTIEISDSIAEATVEEQLAAVGGESQDIYLSKEANREQLEIARRIEYYNAVLVQGPPGTGKTHTIANLLGHFLAQGKSVLVTSSTSKALRVLKDKINPGLQNLCVSVLDDSNHDMEKSIDGITSYMSKSTSFELQNEMDQLAVEREQIITDLAKTRRLIYTLIHQESQCIVYNGEEYSPSAAAQYVNENADSLSFIPGRIQLRASLPLNYTELSELYRTNAELSSSEAQELEQGLPDPASLLRPEDFSALLKTISAAEDLINNTCQGNSWILRDEFAKQQIQLKFAEKKITFVYPNKTQIEQLQHLIQSFQKMEPWMCYAAVDGKKGGAFVQRWNTLIASIEKVCALAEKGISLQFGKKLLINGTISYEQLNNTMIALRSIFVEKGRISKMTLLMHREYKDALEAITINGAPICSVQDCELVLNHLELSNARNECANYWNELLVQHGIPRFEQLDSSEPEQVAKKWIPVIQYALSIYNSDYLALLQALSSLNVSLDDLFEIGTFDSDYAALDKTIAGIRTLLAPICDMFEQLLIINNNRRSIYNAAEQLKQYCASPLVSALTQALSEYNAEHYSDAYNKLIVLFSKQNIQAKREKYLCTLTDVAPEWADAIRNRVGVHGADTVPASIENAWKWKQLSESIDEITAQPFSELQAKSVELSRRYRRITALYAEKRGWYHLLKRTEADIDMKQALQGWRLTVKRIGKGTGKNAPMLKAKARELMGKCQNAVPVWIMPITRALENLDPQNNQFDIIIIDEASQADISALSILFMGKKLIIVGDDKQVSPMAVGVEIDKMNALEQMYIKDKIPNSHLYNAKTSIYDIAATTFQPLMLREHFRCVPDIIGFSNMLSYDNKIKPLREASSSNLLPAVVNYRVANGRRDGRSKTNLNEAKAIVALLQACIEQPEYAEKTFGVISLLGDNQVKLIQSFIERMISPSEIVNRKILSGNSANFQGDERDVVFLSLVDSGDGNGPLRIQNYGADDSIRKRYNVAASRARDQLWVVDSLDHTMDLKAGDIRKILIDYSLSSQETAIRYAESEEKAESPFETSVALALTDRGYHLEQQREVGAYRLDMVAIYKNKMVAIECDGELWHSAESQIRADMERQTILERLGWRFIRIRGSEYYRDPDQTINRVVSELSNYGIEPEGVANMSTDPDSETELLNRVKHRAGVILYGNDGIQDEADDSTLEAALST